MNDVAVSIHEDKIREDEQWDGLKGYVTNTNLQPKDVVDTIQGTLGCRACFSHIQRHN